VRLVVVVVGGEYLLAVSVERAAVTREMPLVR